MSDRKKVVRSAVVVIPPLSVWSSIQDIRKVHDRSYVRWMPHINMLYPFAPDSEFASLKPRAVQALADIKPFDISFNEFKYFQHGKKSSTLWLHPEEDGASTLQDLENQLVDIFPAFTDLKTRSEAGFTPHLTVGQFKSEVSVKGAQSKFQATWNPVRFTVKCLYFISRVDNDPFEVRAIIPLGGLSEDDVHSDFKEKPV